MKNLRKIRGLLIFLIGVAVFIYIVVNQLPASAVYSNLSPTKVNVAYALDPDTYTLGVGTGLGAWRTLPTEYHWKLGCPGGFFSAGHSGVVDVGPTKVHYCWLENATEQDYSTVAFGRAMYGTRLPPTLLGFVGGFGLEILPNTETFVWNKKTWDRALNDFVSTQVNITGKYYDRRFVALTDSESIMNRLTEAIHANGFDLSAENQVDNTGVFKLLGYDKPADDKEGHDLVCKITRLVSNTFFFSFFNRVSVRVSCGYTPS